MNLKIVCSSLCLLTLLVVCSASQAAENPANSYRVDMIITHNGSLVGKPAVEVQPGAETEFRDENPQKPNEGFRILMTLSTLGEAPNGNESIMLKLTFFGRHLGKWVERDSHSITALVGKNVSLAFPSKAPEAPGNDYDLVLTTSKAVSKAAGKR